MLQLLGKPVAESVYNKIATGLKNINFTPHLAVILVGDDPASSVYVSHKQKGCERLGFKSSIIKMPVESSEKKIIEQIKTLNDDKDVHGILVQLPLPAHVNVYSVIDSISPQKDVDGLTTLSLGKLVANKHLIASCTPAGIIELFKYYQIELSGKNILVIGRSKIVGLPLFHLLNQNNATVTLAHSKTKNLPGLTKQFDIVIVAVGKKQFLNALDFKKDAVVVDVGIHREDGLLAGDVNPTGADNHLKALTPVPGGVGPMTIAMLMQNTFKLALDAETNK